MAKTIHRPDYALLTERLRQVREASGQTQTELSRSMGRSQSFLSDIECGKRRIDLLELRDLCGLLGVPWLEFISSLEREFSKAKEKPARKPVRPASRRQ